MAFDNTIKDAKFVYSLIYTNSASAFTMERNTVDKVEDHSVHITSPDGDKRKVSFLDFDEKLSEDNITRDINGIVLSTIMESDSDQDNIVVMYYLDENNAHDALTYFSQFDFDKLYSAYMHILNTTELDNWLIGLTNQIKYIVKYDKKFNLDDIKKYVHEYIDKSLDDPDKKLWDA